MLRSELPTCRQIAAEAEETNGKNCEKPFAAGGEGLFQYVGFRTDSAEDLAPQPGGDAENHQIGDDECDRLNDVILRDAEHDGTQHVPDLEENEERGDGPDEAENDRKEIIKKKGGIKIPPFYFRTYT